MFKLHRSSKSLKPAERIEFSFSSFRVLQVPKGWDKLFVIIYSVKTGKTISKTGKASVRNGNCQWTDTFSESLSYDPSKGPQEGFFKLVVAMGSTKSGILGEATLNLTSYISSEVPVPVSVPLKKCNHETFLQVKIQCLTPKALRNEQPKKNVQHIQNINGECDDVGSNSDVSDYAPSRSFGSSSTNHVNDTSDHGGLYSRETSFSASGSRNSFDSTDEPFSTDGFSPLSNNSGTTNNRIGRQDSDGSQNSLSNGSHSDDQTRSSTSSFKSKFSNSGSRLQIPRDDTRKTQSAVATSPSHNAKSSKDLDTAEVTIEALRAEAMMWEQNARKIMLDLGMLKKELSDQSEVQAKLEVELSASHGECDTLRQEIKQLQISLQESMVKQETMENVKHPAMEMNDTYKELEDEIKFQKESNFDLAVQLKKTQESNLELVAILQELEETIDKQKREIESLSVLKVKFEAMERFSTGNSDSAETNPTEEALSKRMRKASCDSDFEGSIVENPIKDSEAEHDAEDNWKLELQLLQLQESQNDVVCSPELLEAAFKEKISKVECDIGFRAQTLMESESHWRSQLEAKQEEIISLEEKLSKALNVCDAREMQLENGEDNNLSTEFELMKEKIQDLERDCDELTSENLELLLQLKELKKDLPTCPTCHNSTSCFVSGDGFHTYESEATIPNYQIFDLKQGITKNDASIAESASSLQNQHIGQEDKCTDGEIQLQALKDKACYLDISGKHNESYAKLEEHEVEVVSLEQHKECSQEKRSGNDFEFDVAIEMSKISSKLSEELQLCVANVKKQVGALSDSGHNSDCLVVRESRLITGEEQDEAILRVLVHLNKLFEDSQLKPEIGILECHKIQRELDDGFQESLSSFPADRKSSELEGSRHELEIYVSALEIENVQLSERISGLEAQLRYMTDLKESDRLELQASETRFMDLQNEFIGVETELQAQKIDTKQKVHEIQKKWLEAQEECQYLKRANPKLQLTAESLIEECSLLQKCNAELRNQKVEQEAQTTILEAKLKESQEKIYSILSNSEALEAKFSIMLEENASKERFLMSGLDTVLEEHKNYKEKLVLGESILNQMYLDKVVETEHLEREIGHLKEQISATHDERERRASDVVQEASSLRADKAKLQASLQEALEKFNQSEKRLEALQVESENKVLKLVSELASSQQNHEVLMADHKKLLDVSQHHKSNIERFETTVYELEHRLKASERERLQKEHEVSVLNDQLQRTALLHEQILTLKTSLDEAKFENDKLVASFQLLVGDYEDLKAEKESLVQKNSNMQKVLFDYDECGRKRVALEEKILRLEGDLSAREAFCAQEVEMKNELGRTKIINSQLQRKLKSLMEEEEACNQRVHILEEELKQIKEGKIDPNKSRSGLSNQDTSSAENPSSHDTVILSEVDNHQYCDGKNSRGAGIDHISRIQSLENELAEALEANNMYKSQLKRLLSSSKPSHVDATKRQGNEQKEILLEAELRDLRERYFQMSLKYAEVEAQREDLVMKLKNRNNGRSWFS